MALLFGEGFALLTLRDQAMRHGMVGAEGSFRRGVGRLQSIARGAQLGTLLGAGIGGLTVTGFLAASVKTAVSFEYAMAKVKALIGATDEDMDRLADTARDLGRRTMFSASQAAQAMYMLARAGFNVDQIIRAMTPTLNLAAAGELEMGQAADMVARIMSGMKLDASELEHAVDVLVTAFTTANTDLEQLTQGLKFVGPIAKNLGMSFEETVAVIQMFQDAGFQGGMAGRALRQILARLSGGMPEVTKKLQAMGLETQTAGGRFRGMVPIIEDLSRRLGKLNEADRTARIMQLFGSQAGPAMAVALSNGSDELQRLIDQLAGADGKSQQFADTVMNTTQGAVYELKSAVEALQESLGKQLLPTLVKVVNYLREMATAAEKAGGGIFDPQKWMQAVEPIMGLPTWINQKLIGPVARIAHRLGLTETPYEQVSWKEIAETDMDEYAKAVRRPYVEGGPTAYQRARLSRWGRKMPPGRLAEFEKEMAAWERTAMQPVNLTRRAPILRNIRRQYGEMLTMWTVERLMEKPLLPIPFWGAGESRQERPATAAEAKTRILLAPPFAGALPGLQQLIGATADIIEAQQQFQEEGRSIWGFAGGRQLPGEAFGPGVMPGDLARIYDKHGSALIDLTRTTHEATKQNWATQLVQGMLAPAVVEEREPTRPSRFYGLEEFGRSLQERIGAKEDKQFEKRTAEATEGAQSLLAGVKAAVKAVEAKIEKVMTMD